jgi:hypothetical protein
MTSTYINLISSDEEEEEKITLQPRPAEIIDLTQDNDEMSTGSWASPTSKRFLKKPIFIHILQGLNYIIHTLKLFLSFFYTVAYSRLSRGNRWIRKVKQWPITSPSHRQSVAHSVARVSDFSDNK